MGNAVTAYVNLTPARACVGLVEEDLRAMACEQVRHNRPATWHRVPATWLPCGTGVADVHGVNGQQCSHEDENTRISLAEQRSAQTERCRRGCGGLLLQGGAANTQ